jgi:hypothetical protein
VAQRVVATTQRSKTDQSDATGDSCATACEGGMLSGASPQAWLLPDKRTTPRRGECHPSLKDAPPAVLSAEQVHSK